MQIQPKHISELINDFLIKFELSPTKKKGNKPKLNTNKKAFQ